jgi:LacI family transcriptional regulator
VGGMLHPGLTTIREFPEQVGRHMAEQLLDRIANPELESRRLIMPTEFIKRDSCRAVAVAEPSALNEPQAQTATVA